MLVWWDYFSRRVFYIFLANHATGTQIKLHFPLCQFYIFYLWVLQTRMLCVCRSEGRIMANFIMHPHSGLAATCPSLFICSLHLVVYSTECLNNVLFVHSCLFLVMYDWLIVILPPCKNHLTGYIYNRKYLPILQRPPGTARARTRNKKFIFLSTIQFWNKTKFKLILLRTAKNEWEPKKRWLEQHQRRKKRWKWWRMQWWNIKSNCMLPAPGY